MKLQHYLLGGALCAFSVSGLAAEMKNPLSVHVLNLQTGVPTAGIEVELDKQQGEQAASAAALKAELSSLQEQVRAWNQRPVSVAAVVPAVTSGAVVVRKKNTPKAQRPATTPFVLTGIERRGGIAFAAIAPQSATQLTEIVLMEPGETQRGWTLLAITGQQAQFRVAGQTRMLTAR